MSRLLRLDICDYDKNVLCNIYDSTTNIAGQAYDVFVNTERNGWKELEFSIPSVINGPEGEEPNYRLDKLVADFRIRLVDDYETDWFIISEPKITHNHFSKTVSVRAVHLSQILKTKNMGLEFSDEYGNNVGTAEQFLTTILEGTGWEVGEVKEFLDDDGTIKQRTLNAPARTGALKMINDLCELFDAKAVYHGDSKTVDLLPLNPFSEDYTEGTVPSEVNLNNALELHYNKNITSITRTLNTENMITKLYAYGSYGDVAEGICNIATCKHKEYTFTGLQPNTEYKFKTGSKLKDGITEVVFYFTTPDTVTGTGHWSDIDLLSRSYVWDGDTFYPTYKLAQSSNPPSQFLTYTVEEKENYVPFLMSFDYYRKIGLLNDEKFLELAKYQRSIAGYHKTKQEKSIELSEAKETLSATAESNTGYLKLAVTDYDDDEGGLKINFDMSQGRETDGVLYRTDYKNIPRNYFSWFVADQLKSNGDPVSMVGSKVLIVHPITRSNPAGPQTWEFAYVKKIWHMVDGQEQVISDDQGNPTHYHYDLTEGERPCAVTLWLGSGEFNPETGDRFFLFCTNSMTGRLGTHMSTDEAILQTLDSQLTDETVKHPVFFTNTVVPQANDPDFDKITDYGWKYRYHKSGTDYRKGWLYFYNKTEDTSWVRVWILDQHSGPQNDGDYFFNTRTRVLHRQINGSWVPMTDYGGQKLANQFSQVILLCRERDRVYKGWYQRYQKLGGKAMSAGNYAFKNEYDEYWLFTTTKGLAANNTNPYIDTETMQFHQSVSDPEDIVSVAVRKQDTIKYFKDNELKDAIFAVGSLQSTTGQETASTTRQRSNYIRIYPGVTYAYNVDIVSSSEPVNWYVYYYDQNKTFIKRSQLSGTINISDHKSSGTFTTPKSTFTRATTEGPITAYSSGAYYARFLASADASTEYQNSSVSVNGVDTKLIAGDQVYSIVGLGEGGYFEGTGEYLGINNLIKQFAKLSDDCYGELLSALLQAEDTINEKDAHLTEILGDLLREGAWQDDNYVEKDEPRLYKDALDNLREISKPETTYDINFLDLYDSNKGMEFAVTGATDISWPDIQVTDAVHLIDEDLDISCWGYIDRLNKCYDQPWRTNLEINTKLTLIDQHDFTDVMTRIAEVAKETKGKQTLYQRSAALTNSGQLTAEKLTGTLNAYTTTITGGASNWSTDEKGNMVFLSADGTSAMMLSGTGLLIANSRNGEGEWEWRTAMTGSGIVADAVTTGMLSAVLIEAGSITTDKLSSTIGNDLDISSNTALNLFATVDGSRPAGTVQTPNGSHITIAAASGNTPARIGIVSGGELYMNGGKVNINANTELNMASGKNMTVKAGGKMIFESNTLQVESTNFKISSTGNVEMKGTVTATGGKVAEWLIDGYKLYSGNSSTRVMFDSGTANQDYAIWAGHNTASSAPFSVQRNGTLTASSGTIGGWTIGAKTLTSGSGDTYVRIDSGTTGVTSVFWAGNENGGSAPFRITRAGAVMATSGKIGGWTLSSTSINAGSSSSYVEINSSSNNDYAIWAGNETNSSAPFSVQKDGTLKATSGTVGGWTLAAKRLYSGTDGTYVAIDSNSAVDYAIWAGAGSASNAPFHVKKNGYLYSISGKIGNWTIGATRLSSGSNGTYVAIDSGTTNIDYAFWAGNASPASAKFSVTRGGDITATGGKIGGWTINGDVLSSDKTSVSANAFVGLDASNTLYPLPGGTETSMVAFWAGGTTPQNAKFVVTKDGAVIIKELRVQTKTNTYETIDFSNFVTSEDVDPESGQTFDFSSLMGKLKFQTIKKIATKSTGEVVIYYTNNSGGTASATFNSAASVTGEGAWSSYHLYGELYGQYDVTNSKTGTLLTSTVIHVGMSRSGRTITTTITPSGGTSETPSSFTKEFTFNNIINMRGPTTSSSPSGDAIGGTYIINSDITAILLTINGEEYHIKVRKGTS